jgi:hypothetical protein
MKASFFYGKRIKQNFLSSFDFDTYVFFVIFTRINIVLHKTTTLLTVGSSGATARGPGNVRQQQKSL